MEEKEILKEILNAVHEINERLDRIEKKTNSTIFGKELNDAVKKHTHKVNLG